MSELPFFTRWIGRAYRYVFSPLFAEVLRHRGILVGKKVVFYGMPLIECAHGGSIEIGDECVICSNSRYTAMGVCRPVIVRALVPGARVRLGKRVGISGAVICSAVSVEVGDDCLLGSGCVIVDTDFHPIAPEARRTGTVADAKAKGVTVDRNVFLGAGSFVCKGVAIGADAVVGAMSVVTKNIPPGAVAAGNPASIVRNTVLEKTPAA